MRYYRFGKVIMKITREQEERILRESLLVERARFREWLKQEVKFNVASIGWIRRLL